jgi:hypothetical protein
MGKAEERIALDPDAVAITAKRVGSHADDVRANHAATHDSLNDALSRHVGDAGARLSDSDDKGSERIARLGDQMR